MDYFYSILFGLVQGITEFWPVSSSGHLVILHEIVNQPIKDNMIFDVALHLATTLAVIIFFWKEIIKLIQGWFKSISGQKDDYGRLAWLIVLGTIPAAFFGYFWEDTIENVLRSPLVVIIMLVVIALLFFVVERWSKKQNGMNSLNWKSVLLIGVAQALALVPGTSRSGITIIAGMSANLKREEAVRFSFLLSIPIILAASAKKLPELFQANMSGNEYIIFVIGFVSAFAAGILAIKFLLELARKYTLKGFAIYRIILAAILIAYFYL